VTSRSGLPKTPSPTSMHQACGRARSLRKLFRQATSGRLNPSIRIISNEIATATLAISSGPTGDCRFAPTRLQSRHTSKRMVAWYGASPDTGGRYGCCTRTV
jgi:hypothetical protein